ncbi:MAG: hypothetical protein ACI9UT_001381 [Flavobacteriales bacterium]|jgi:hypothetical protein
MVIIDLFGIFYWHHSFKHFLASDSHDKNLYEPTPKESGSQTLHIEIYGL